MKSFDKAAVQKLRKEINKALEPLAKAHNLSIAATNATFTANDINFKLQVLTTERDGKPRDMDAEAFLDNAERIGLKKEHLNAPITLRGVEFTVVGYRPKARKNPIVIRDASGKQFVTSLFEARMQLVTLAPKTKP